MRRYARAPLLVAALAACSQHHGAAPPGGGGPGGGGPGGGNAPATPGALRLGPHPQGPPRYVLEWNAATAVAIDHFTVYAAAAPIAAPDPGAILAQVDGNNRSLPIQLPVDTGMRHLRIAAVGTDARTSPLSAELAVDTAGRIAFVVRPTGAPNLDLFARVPGDASGPQNLSALPPTAAITDYMLAPDGRSVAFVADRDTSGVRELFAAPLATPAAPVKLSGAMAAGGRVLGGAHFSPDGTRVAFAADRVTPGTVELFVAPTDGSAAPVKLSGTMVPGGSLEFGNPPQTFVAWSPAGDRVAYAADQRLDGVLELFVARADGSSLAVAVGGDVVPTASLVQFAWSPQGDRIAFTADRRADGVFELFVAAPGGQGEPTVRSGAQLATADVSNFAWSPDGTRLAFVSTRRAATLLEVYVTDADGTGEPIPLDATQPSFAQATRFLWSPDGANIAFACDREVDGQFELFVAPSTGATAATKVSGTMTLRGDVAEFAWSPDSTQLAFRSDRVVDERYELFVTAPGFAGPPLPLSGSMPANSDLLDFAWSPDGQRIGFRADLLTDDQYDLFVVDRSGSAAPVPLGTGGAAASSTLPAAWSALGRR